MGCLCGRCCASSYSRCACRCVLGAAFSQQWLRNLPVCFDESIGGFVVCGSADVELGRTGQSTRACACLRSVTSADHLHDLSQSMLGCKLPNIVFQGSCERTKLSPSTLSRNQVLRPASPQSLLCVGWGPTRISNYWVWPHLLFATLSCHGQTKYIVLTTSCLHYKCTKCVCVCANLRRACTCNASLLLLVKGSWRNQAKCLLSEQHGLHVLTKGRDNAALCTVFNAACFIY